MLTIITQQKVPEIERHLEALKAAGREGDIERLEKSIQQLDKAVFSLLVEIYWRQRRKGSG